jgi:ethanolamine ammonia-lyase small subunit
MALDLRRFTPARVDLGRAGHSVPTAELLKFQFDHAAARDAVHETLDPLSLGLDVVTLETEARDRAEYVRRPDLGQIVSAASAGLLRPGDYDAAIVIAGGLSARAVHRHAAPLLVELMPKLAEDGWKLAPLTAVPNGRVAVGDDIGSRLGARMVVVLIGERPGLSSPDSLGAYLTWNPRAGRTNAERNCISNIRPEGLGYRDAALRLHRLMSESRRLQISGVSLKDEQAPRIEG